MVVKVLTYDNPNDFYTKKEFAPYKKYLHICATSSLKHSLKNNQYILGEVLTAKEVIELFYPTWNLPVERFTQYAKLADKLRGYKKVGASKIIQSFKRNKLDLLITMRNLTEIGLKPIDLRKYLSKVEEEVFCDIWDLMYEEFSPLMKVAENKLFSKNIKEILGEYKGFDDECKIILHGFYYISPVQHYVFSKWKSIGIELVFLNLYSRNYPSTFKFIEENFSENNGWAKKTNWVAISTEPQENAEKFAATLEGESLISAIENVSEKVYEYALDFVNDLLVEKENGGPIYLSPSSDSLNERLSEYHDGKDTKKHFLSYPIGQYLFGLHVLYNEEEQDYLINGKNLLDFFNSGWLRKNDVNAKEYTYKLKKILPYFDDCKTISEWQNRFEKLIDLKKKVDDESIDSQIPRNINEGFLKAKTNPFLRFSFLSLSLEETREIQLFFEKILEDAKKLMEVEKGRVTLKYHFDKIKSLLKDSGLKENLIIEEENELIKSLEGSLSMFGTGDTLNVVDLSEALTVFLGKGFDSEDKMNDYQKIIKPLEQLDGLILNNKNELHLCAMDEKSFPSKSVPMPWPLSKETLAKMNHAATNMYLFREKYQTEISKYLFFQALSYKGSIKFSWIKNWKEEENLDKSVYVDLLNLNQSFEEEDIDFKYLEEEDSLVFEGDSQYANHYPQEESIEANICVRRFFFSTIFSSFSSYENTFHYTFLLGTAAKINAVKRMTEEENIATLKELYPPFSKSKLAYIVSENLNYIDNFKRYNYNLKYYNETPYFNYASNFQFLTHRGGFDHRIWKEAFTKRNNQNFFSTTLFKTSTVSFPEANPSYLCRFCPHQSYCKDSEYPIDLNDS